MKPLLIPRVKDQIARKLGLSFSADEARRNKFQHLTGDDWLSTPDQFCQEEERIHPKLIGRFYGENNLKKCALEIRRIDDVIALRCAYRTRSRSTWSDKSQARQSNRYYSLVIKGEEIGNKNGLHFRRGPDGRYFLGYKNHMEMVMKKV